MKIVFDQPQAVVKVIEASLGVPLKSEMGGIAAVDDNGDFIGGAVFSGYTGFDVNMTVAGPGCLTRATIRATLRHVFITMGCLHLTAQTKRSNRITRKLLEKAGFACVAVLPRHFGPVRGDDAFLFRLSKEKAERWLR